jgi:hypothetical protein
MIHFLPKESQKFEQFHLDTPLEIPMDSINGCAVLCSWPREDFVGHSSFSFDEPASASLYTAKYHHRIINSVDAEIAKRNKQGRNPFGGAVLQIEKGKVSICWTSREEAETVKSCHHHAQAIEELNSAYTKALEQSDIETLFSNHKELSGVFLPSPSQNYFKSNPRVLVIGQETRGWRNQICNLKNEFFIDKDGIDASMNLSSGFAKSGASKSKFLQFYRKISSKIEPSSNDAAVWSNQFCVSYKSGSPIKLPTATFNIVKKLSFDLLRAQFEILRPDVVIFATGPSRDKYIKECFSEYEMTTVMKIDPPRLWHFKIGSINCIRVSHPRWVRGTKYLEHAIQMVTEFS